MLQLHFCFHTCLLPGTTLVGVGGRHGCPHVGRRGVARYWAICCGQYQESESVMGTQSGSTAEIDFPSLDWCSQRWIGLHSGCGTGSFGKNQDVGAPGTIWGGSSPGRHCGIGVYVVSSVCHSGPGPFFAVLRAWISLRKNRMVDDKKDQRQKPRNGSSSARRARSGGRRDSG